MNKLVLTIIIIGSLFIGSVGGFALAVEAKKHRLSTEADIQVRTFAISYAALRNYTEHSDVEANQLMYKFMNTSLKKLNELYPDASDDYKETIYISFTGYTDYIQNNSKYIQPDLEINGMVQSLIKKHNKAFKRDAEKAPRPLT